MGVLPIAVAHYLWPPYWLVAPPKGATQTPATNRPHPGDFSDVVYESTLPAGIRMRACRDGMLVWDCTDWASKPPFEDVGPDPNAEMAFQVKAVRLMNVYLACLYQAYPSLGKAHLVTPAQLLYVDFEAPELTGGSSAEPLGYCLGLLRSEKDCLFHDITRRTIDIASLKKADWTLRQLLALEPNDNCLFRAEMVYRSLAAYLDFDDGAALVNAWLAIEGLLGDHLRGFLSGEANRPTEDGRKFINSDREAFLLGSAVSSRITAEILSLVDAVPFDLYRDVRAVAQARNKWLHEARPSAVDAKNAELAIETAGKLFELVEGVNFSMPVGRVVLSTAWRTGNELGA